ncbi:chaperone required for assembly of F1-ATPase [Novosphingobium capsulatum]|uniref:Chaperone required for assembly of F1-ATPase n=1 Tax=Novosphingobium capsulatum TaxID=13688 RepID=A0ABU1MMY1_9SPHN|nr:ATP12 family protein [Novosphingobium capsulatum]MDR6511690.1 chaperone required for assembly of F1-ATPase [Novosphingobium capsulatum]
MKRFYQDVTVSPEDAGFRVCLDGRGIRTQGGRPQIVPTAALAEAMAGEWANQGETIDTAAFAFRDMADYAIDVVAPAPAAARTDLLPYAETDTLCYRAEPDEPLAARQRLLWEPLVAMAEARYGVAFIRVAGIMHKPQPAPTLAALAAELEQLSPFALAALRNTATLSCSLIIGLAALDPGADVAALWDAACVEEDWQAELWGKDEMAQARRTLRGEAFATAARFAQLL